MSQGILKMQGTVEPSYRSSLSALPGTPGAPAEWHSYAPRGEFILVIDDSPTIRRVVEMLLRQEGYEIQSFRDGVDAMRWCAMPESRTPDLMLVDLGLPKMDGYDVIQKFKAKPRFANTICIILSQRDGVVDKLKGRMVGAVAYITKPFTSRELVTVVQTALAGNERFDTGE
jgi:twitching motility two-component system response regulator PilG